MFLGMRIQYDDKRGYMVDQEHAIIEMLAKHGLENANSVRLPIGTGEPTSDLSDKLLPVTAEVDPKIPTVKDFQSLVGSLLWIARGTRPVVMFAVHRATRRTHAPTLQDWKLAKRIARYLSGTRDLKLQLLEDAKEIAEVNCAAGPMPILVVKSQTGIQGMTVDWQCKKQTAVALSTAEAEFVAASIGGQDVLGINELFKEIGLSVKLPIEMKMDNQAAMKQLTNE
ncbi:Transposon Polyprotein Reverse transcriptase, partial [Phytophthora palmivora]